MGTRVMDVMGKRRKERQSEGGWTAVLCDKQMNVKINGNVYRTVVRPTLKHGLET